MACLYNAGTLLDELEELDEPPPELLDPPPELAQCCAGETPTDRQRAERHERTTSSHPASSFGNAPGTGLWTSK
jgi:hypothetical protein